MRTLMALVVVLAFLLTPFPDWLKQGLFIMLFLPAFWAVLVYKPKRRQSIRE